MILYPVSQLPTDQTFEIAFATFTARITIRSDHELKVETVEDGKVTFSDTVDYEAVAIRDGLVFLSWREHIGSTIVHTLDFVSGDSYTAVTPAKGGFMRLKGRIDMKLSARASREG